MKLIRPLLIPAPFNVASHHLTSSNVTETEYAAYVITTAYLPGDRVQVVDPTNTVTISIGIPCLVTWAAHALPDKTAVRITTTGALPTGLTAGQVYYTKNTTADTFEISEIPSGAALNTSGTQSGTHTALATLHNVYEALEATTGDAPPISPVQWALADATNRWRMHSGVVSSQTSNVDVINNTYKIDGRANAVVLLNINGASAQVVMTDTVDGVVFDETKSGISLSGINDFYKWYFEPPSRISELAFFDLPNYTGAEIQIIITDTGGTALCGALVIGNNMDMGHTFYGMGMSIQDFSVKDVDAFGNASVTERSFRREINIKAMISNNMLDAIFNELAKLRARPVVFIGADQYGASMAYGYYRDFNIELALTNDSFINIEIEGLT
jgi:hypothetical protein